jgi:hypothetical protein
MIANDFVFENLFIFMAFPTPTATVAACVMLNVFVGSSARAPSVLLNLITFFN